MCRFIFGQVFILFLVFLIFAFQWFVSSLKNPNTKTQTQFGFEVFRVGTNKTKKVQNFEPNNWFSVLRFQFLFWSAETLGTNFSKLSSPLLLLTLETFDGSDCVACFLCVCFFFHPLRMVSTFMSVKVDFFVFLRFPVLKVL